MSVHFISGKPGGGKSLYAVRLVVDELVHGSRTVITNLPLELGRLNEFLQERFPGKTVDIFQRIILLEDGDVANGTQRFWTVRPGRPRISCLSAAEWSAGQKPDYSQVRDGGVLYVVDEVHNFFNARAWAETGRDVLFYLSQHRKLGDDVIAVTQHVGNVDKQFRSLAQDYTYLRNLHKERMGIFRLPARFVRRTYLQPATERSVPCETGTFSLDVSGLASCYNTAKGVSIHGRMADRGKGARGGVSWVWFLVGVPLVAVLFLKGVPLAFGHLFSVSKRVHAAPALRALPVGDSQSVAAPARFQPSLFPPSVSSAATNASAASAATGVFAGSAATNVVRVTGIVTFGGAVRITLSDGRVLDSRRGDVESLSRDELVIRGGEVVSIPVGSL